MYVVKWVHFDQVQIVVQILVQIFEQNLEKLGHEHDGGTDVKTVSVFFEIITSATFVFVFSKTSTSYPALANLAATARPPKPAPITTTFFLLRSAFFFL